MKKAIFIIGFIITTIFLSSCGETVCEINDSNVATSEIGNETAYSYYSYSIDDFKGDQKILKNYFVDSDFDRSDIVSSISDYGKSSEASVDFVSAYRESNEIKILPVYGIYLEKTSLVVCLFYKDDNLIATKTIEVDEIENVEKIQEFSFLEVEYVTELSDEYCFKVLEACIKNSPDFKIVGVVYNTTGYRTIYPIGFEKNSNILKYYFGEVMDFQLVDQFSSVEEGAKAYEEYWETKNEILSKIPIYEWKNKQFYNTGYINPFQYEYMYKQGVDASVYAYVNDYDSVIAVPLIDENGNEDVYVLHLLYYHNNLLGELILEYLPNEEVWLRAVYENVAEKDKTSGEYIYLEKSEYQRVYEEYVAANPGVKIKAIAFDGEQYKVMK